MADTQFSPKPVNVNGQFIFQVDKENTIEGVTIPDASPDKPGFFKRLFFKAPPPRQIAVPVPVPSPEDELKFHGKLQYLQENIKKLEFINLNADATSRSRCPVICLSGFF